MAGRSGSRTVAVIALGGAAVIAAMGVREVTRPFDTATWGRVMEARLRETAAALHARAATLAELPRLAAAVSTDARTVRDLTQDELAFRTRPSETIAIGQVAKKANVDGKGDRDGNANGNGNANAPVVLLVLPPQAHAPPLLPLAVQVRIDGAALVVSEAIKVVPRERADEIDGVVAVGLAVELADLSRDLLAVGIGARIVVGGRGLDIGVSDPPADYRRLDRPVPNPAGADLQLVLSAPRALNLAPYLGGVAVLALVALWFALRARRAVFVPVDGPVTLPLLWAAPVPASPVSTSAASASAPAAVVIGGFGRKIGRYEIVQHIGTGGMADVYLAHATGEAGFTRKIALKILSPDYAGQPRQVEQFLDEARLAALLDHPNIVQITDLGHADDAYFIAMDYVDGADLRRLVDMSSRQHRPIAEAVVIAILRKICDGLYAAHTARGADGAPLHLVHRDVKSGNVFVARNGVVKIGDFGIAKASHASRITRTERGQVKGTPGYMAPEQRMGLPIDGRADLYGVGAIAYEMLSGVPVNLDFMVVSLKGKEGWPHLAPLSRLRSDVSSELEALIFRALAYDPQDRFPDCAEMEVALEEIAKRHPPIASDKTIARWIDATLATVPLTLVSRQRSP